MDWAAPSPVRRFPSRRQSTTTRCFRGVRPLEFASASPAPSLSLPSGPFWDGAKPEEAESHVAVFRNKLLLP